jgi:hypothetical protein
MRRETMPGVLFLAIALAILAFGCGAPPPLPDGLRLEAGTYGADAYVKATEGRCGWLEREFHSSVSVDDGGQVLSPLPSSISCVTTYAEGLEVECTGLGATLQLRGEVYELDRVIAAGEVTGNVGGCRRAVLGVFLWRLR